MRRPVSALVIIGFVILVILIGLLNDCPLYVRWAMMMVVFVGLLAFIGWEISGSKLGDVAHKHGRFDGVLIDSRNKISLSRLQLVLWTVIILSAWATLAFNRLIPLLKDEALGSVTVVDIAKQWANGQTLTEVQERQVVDLFESHTGESVIFPDEASGEPATSFKNEPLDVFFPRDVWLVLGISLGSLVAAGAIKSNQASQKEGAATQVLEGRIENDTSRVSDLKHEISEMKNDKGITNNMASDDLDNAVEKLRVESKEFRATEAEHKRAERSLAADSDVKNNAEGQLHTNPSPADARWSDMMRGETVANYMYVDVGKVQMFLFTIILVFTYATLLWSMMDMTNATVVLRLLPKLTLPTFSESALIVLAISHVGYAAAKATTTA